MPAGAHTAASGRVEGACLAREHAGEAPRAPKLIDVVRDALRARHYSRRTERAYVGWIRRYILFHGKRHPRELGAAEATRFLSALAVDQGQCLDAESGPGGAPLPLPRGRSRGAAMAGRSWCAHVVRV